MGICPLYIPSLNEFPPSSPRFKFQKIDIDFRNKKFPKSETERLSLSPRLSLPITFFCPGVRLEKYLGFLRRIPAGMKCLLRCFRPKGGEVRRKNHLVSNSIPSTNRVWLRFTRSFYFFQLLWLWSIIPLDLRGLQDDQDSLVPKRQLGSFFLGNLPIHVFVMVFTRLLLMDALV